MKKMTTNGSDNMTGRKLVRIPGELLNCMNIREANARLVSEMLDACRFGNRVRSVCGANPFPEKEASRPQLTAARLTKTARTMKKLHKAALQLELSRSVQAAILNAMWLALRRADAQLGGPHLRPRMSVSEAERSKQLFRGLLQAAPLLRLPPDYCEDIVTVLQLLTECQIDRLAEQEEAEDDD